MPKPFTIQPGQSTPWMDCRQVAQSDIVLNVINDDGVTATIDVATDETPRVKADGQAYDTITASGAWALAGPLPCFIRITNNGAPGSAPLVVGFGFGRDANGASVPIKPETIPSGTTGDF